MTETLDEQLTKYLTDAHSIEEQALAQMRAAPKIAGDADLAAMFERHLGETESHERLVRELLERRGASPSKVKDAVMAAGGAGFVLFARSQPDTPGKLVAHAVSYENLELAAYELLLRVAQRAGASDVVEAAQRIRDEERAMSDRLESGYDRAVAASLRDVGRDDFDAQLNKYLADAHALEAQSIQLLERGPKIVGEGALAEAMRRHLDESREHQRLVEARLEARGGSPSTIKDAAMRLGALNWGGFFQAHPDTPGKLAAFAFAFEHLEIGGYEQLRRVAERAADGETAALAETVLAQERGAAEAIAAQFDNAVDASIEALGVTV